MPVNSNLGGLNPHYSRYCQVPLQVCVAVCKLLCIWELPSFPVGAEKTEKLKRSTINCQRMCFPRSVYRSHLLFLKTNECTRYPPTFEAQQAGIRPSLPIWVNGEKKKFPCTPVPMRSVTLSHFRQCVRALMLLPANSKQNLFLPAVDRYMNILAVSAYYKGNSNS